MPALHTPIGDFGWPVADFSLPATDGREISLASARGPNGLLVMFICNHCPYVQAIIDRIGRDCRELSGLGVGSVAIMSNDPTVYAEDSFENMRRLAKALDLPFPYLYDETQATAKAYGAMCTPDFFGFNADLELQYRGRLDASGINPAPPGSRRELFEAMQLIARTGVGPSEQHFSIGCSIKWRD